MFYDMTGDGENDLTMLRNVHCAGGEGVAMANGMEQVKLAAVKTPAINSAIVPEYA